MKKMHDTANILGFSFFSNNKSWLLKKIKKNLIEQKSVQIIFTPNAEQLVQAQKNPNLNRYLKAANLLLADGMSVVWSSKILYFLKRSQPIAERISGVDLVKDLLEITQDQKLSTLIIGGRDYHNLHDFKQASGTQSFKAQQISPYLYWTPGFKKVTQSSIKEEQMLKKLLLTMKPAVVFVAFGAPYQEQWLMEHKELLNQSQVKIAVSVGGAFDIIFGRLKRAPVWMQDLGLEWFFRLLQEPWRWKRQLRLIKFVRLITRQIVKGDSSE